MTATVLGIGNLLVADDGAGIRAVRSLCRTIADARVRCVESERGGLDILEHLEGVDRAIIIDAARTGTRPQGSITRITLARPFAPGCHPSLHALSIDAVLSLGSSAGVSLPDRVSLYLIEVADIESFGAGCTKKVASAIPRVAAMVREELRTFVPGLRTVTEPLQRQSVENAIRA